MRQHSARIESELQVGAGFRMSAGGNVTADTLQTISKQLAKLSVATEHRHSTLRDMFRRAVPIFYELCYFVPTKGVFHAL